jgi:syntaxin 5
MAVASIQDRTSEFKSVLAQAQRKQATSKVSSQRRSLLTDAQKNAANGNADGRPRRSDFARKAAEIGRGISATMGKLEKLAQCEFLSYRRQSRQSFRVSRVAIVLIAKG